MSDQGLSGEASVRVYDCPCCGEQYTAHSEVSSEYEDAHGNITELPGGLVWADEVTHFKTTAGKLLEKCSVCGLPCCPRCVSVFGEGRIVCTRCTSNRNCVHDGTPYGE